MLCFVTSFSFTYLPLALPLPFTFLLPPQAKLFLFYFYLFFTFWYAFLVSTCFTAAFNTHNHTHNHTHTHTLASNYYYDFYQSLPDVDWSYCAFNVRINNKPSKVHYQLVMVEMVIKLFYRACHLLWWGVVFAVIVSLESVKRPCFAIVVDDHNWSALILSMSVIWCCSDHVTW